MRFDEQASAAPDLPAVVTKGNASRPLVVAARQSVTFADGIFLWAAPHFKS